MSEDWRAIRAQHQKFAERMGQASPPAPPVAYEPCADCSGTGLALNMAGEPDVCRECGGDTVTPVAPAVAVPEGWKLVPIEPDFKMTKEGRALSDFAKDVWSSMLAAAPEPPAHNPKENPAMHASFSRKLYDGQIVNVGLDPADILRYRELATHDDNPSARTIITTRDNQDWWVLEDFSEVHERLNPSPKGPSA